MVYAEYEDDFEPNYKKAIQQVINWAKSLLEENHWLILDTETTGL